MTSASPRAPETSTLPLAGLARTLEALSPRQGAGVRVVCETPRGARVKIKLDPRIGAFVRSRRLPVGLSYPYDWGFVPGTLASDGDPLDALVLSDEETAPGVITMGHLVGVLRVSEPGPTRRRVRNDRLLVVPSDHVEHVRTLNDVPSRVRRELELFFEAVVVLEKEGVSIEGWGGAREADALVSRTERAFERAHRE